MKSSSGTPLAAHQRQHRRRVYIRPRRRRAGPAGQRRRGVVPARLRGGSIRFFEPEMDHQLRERRTLQHDLRSATRAASSRCTTSRRQKQRRVPASRCGALASSRHGLVPGDLHSARRGERAHHRDGRVGAARSLPRSRLLAPARCRSPSPLAVQFQRGDLPRVVHRSCWKPPAANRLELEITEGVLIGDFSARWPSCASSRRSGCRSRWTFRNRLSRCPTSIVPFDKIKIDRSFISNIERNPSLGDRPRRDRLGHGLNCRCRRRVETPGQMASWRASAATRSRILLGRPAPSAICGTGRRSPPRSARARLSQALGPRGRIEAAKISGACRSAATTPGAACYSAERC